METGSMLYLKTLPQIDNYIFLFALLCVFFWRALRCGYVVDDDFCSEGMRIKKKEFKEGKRTFLNMLWHSCYGSGVFNTARQEYIFTLVLHFINCCLICNISGSLLAAVLYMINPVNNQTALWLNGRRYAISVLCVLLVWTFKPLALLLYPFAIWIHVSAAALPLLFMTTKYWWATSILIAAACCFGWRHVSTFLFRKSEFTKNNELHKIKIEKAILYVKSIGFYFFHCLLPVNPRMYHQFLYYFSRYPKDNEKGYSLDLDFWKGVGVMAFLGYEIIGQHNIWALWFLVFISQWCNIITVTMSVADRYSAIANVGLMILLSDYLLKIPQPYSLIAITTLLTFYVMKYQPLFRAHRNVEDFLLYQINDQPDGVEARSILGCRYMSQGDPMSAYAIIKKGLKYRPSDFKLLIVMAQCMFSIGKIDKGLKILDVAEKNCPLGDEENCRVEFARIRNNFNNQPANACR